VAIRDKGRMVDGITSIEGGMDSGRSPSMLNRNQCAYAGNVTFRGGYATTRPTFRRIPLASASSTPASTMTSNRFQGASYYNKGSGYVVCQVYGNVYQLAPPSSGTEWTVSDITNSNSMDTDKERVYFEQAEDYLIIQDGVTAPFIWNNSSSRYSLPNSPHYEVPIGTGPMAYGNGRLWVAKGRDFIAGDILGGDNGVLKFTENTYLAGGGAFSVAVGSSPITSMQFVAAPNTALGQGELMVMTNDVVTAVTVPPDRYDWFWLRDPVQKVLLVNNGSASHFSTDLVNGDVYTRSQDGIRSVISAVREFSAGPGNTPISREMHRILKYDEAKWLPYTSGVYFDNRYLVTAMPNEVTDKGVAYKGLVSLDFDLISGMGQKSPAAYDGFWTLDVTRSGEQHQFEFLQILTGKFNGEERCICFVRNEDDETELWELLRSDDSNVYDIDYAADLTEVHEKVTSELETPSFDFEQIGSAKILESADLWVDKVSGGRVDFHIDFHPDQYPCWVEWQNWHVIAEYQSEDCQSFVDYQHQYRPRMRIGRPPDTEEPGAGKTFNYGWEFSARIKWVGHARIKLFRLNARETQEEPYADVDIDSTAKAIACDCLSGVNNATNQ